jgi:rare lipoprotein A
MKLNLILFFILLNLNPLMASEVESRKDSKANLKIQEGIASFYGRRFHLRKTANGETFRMEEMTAAHKNLPFGTRLKVTNTKTGKQVWVRINDRLPQNSKRIIDLSRGAAKELGMIQDGVVPVEIEVQDQIAILSLMEHYREKKPEDIRLRINEEPIDFFKSDVCWMEVVLKTQGRVDAGI